MRRFPVAVDMQPHRPLSLLLLLLLLLVRGSTSSIPQEPQEAAVQSLQARRLICAVNPGTTPPPCRALTPPGSM